jgi:hypothetical protein
MPRHLSAIALAAALLLLACGGEETTSATSRPAAVKPKPKAPAGPALCTTLTPRVTGRAQPAAATELSGLVLSRSQPGVLWTHNDSGDRARVLALAPDGRQLADVDITGADAVDWEDIAATKDALYLGDIGDNAAARETIAVYRVPEPRVPATGPADAQRLTLRYPDGAHDAEALLVDPTNGALVIVTKDLRGASRIYTAIPSPTEVTTLRLAGTLALGIGEAVTAGDVSADGRTVALRTYDRAFVWTRKPGRSVPATLLGKSCTPKANLLAEGQGEALALTRDGRRFYTVPEGPSPSIRIYRHR